MAFLPNRPRGSITLSWSRAQTLTPVFELVMGTGTWSGPTTARANLAALCDEVTANREVVIIHRRGAEDVALIAAEELSGLLETAHLLWFVAA
jgi:hypothetical protein